MSSDFVILYCAVLIPIIPAWILFRYFKTSSVIAKGPLQGISYNVTGAFGGYFIVLVLLVPVVDATMKRDSAERDQASAANLQSLTAKLKRQTDRADKANAALEAEISAEHSAVWTIRAHYDFRDKQPNDRTPVEVGVKPPRPDYQEQNYFEIDAALPRKGNDPVRIPHLIVSSPGYIPTEVVLTDDLQLLANMNYTIPKADGTTVKNIEDYQLKFDPKTQHIFIQRDIVLEPLQKAPYAANKSSQAKRIS